MTDLHQQLIDAIRSVPADVLGDGTEAIADAVLAVVQAADLRCCTQCGAGDLYPRRCSQCGGRWADRACGPTHALIVEELGLGDLRRELATAVEWADRLAEVITPPEVLGEQSGYRRWERALDYANRRIIAAEDPAPRNEHAMRTYLGISLLGLTSELLAVTSDRDLLLDVAMWVEKGKRATRGQYPAPKDGEQR